jgi:hypothetical protein
MLEHFRVGPRSVALTAGTASRGCSTADAPAPPQTNAHYRRIERVRLSIAYECILNHWIKKDPVGSTVGPGLSRSSWPEQPARARFWQRGQSKKGGRFGN